MLERIKNEPVVVASAVEALLGLGASFGLDLTAEQTTSILVFTGAVLALFVRGKVSPVRA